MIELILFALFISYSTQYEVGPFKVIISGFKRCKEEGTHMNWGETKVSVVKRNAPLMLNANVSNLLPLDDSVEATIYATYWGNGGWKENAWVQKLGGVCSTLSNFLPDFFQRLLKSMGLQKCPIPAGNHTIKNFELKLPVQVPLAPYGRWKADVVLGNKKYRKLGCVYLDFDIVQKKGHPNY